MEKQSGPKNHIRIGLNTRVGRVVSYVNELIKTENPSSIFFSAIGSSIGTLVNVVEAVKTVNAKEFYQINKISSVSTNSVDNETKEKHVERLSPKMDITLTLEKPTGDEVFQDKLSEESRLKLFDALNNRRRGGNYNRGRGFGGRGRGRGFGGRGRGFGGRGRGFGGRGRGIGGRGRGLSRGRGFNVNRGGFNNNRDGDFNPNRGQRGNMRRGTSSRGRFIGRGFNPDRNRDFIPRERGNRGFGRGGYNNSFNDNSRMDRNQGDFGYRPRGGFPQMSNRGRGFNQRGGMINGPNRRGGY